MYDKRIKIFIISCGIFFLIFLVRLVHIQLLPDSALQEKITQLKRQRGRTIQLKTARGKILDRNRKILAIDQPRFFLCLNYQLACFADPRLRKAMLLKAAGQTNPQIAASLQKDIDDNLQQIEQLIEKCTYFGVKRDDIETEINSINDRIWKLRTFLAWFRNGASKALLAKYENKISNIPFTQAMEDFEKQYPDPDKRLLLTLSVDDIAEFKKSWPILELESDDDIFTAQVEFVHNENIEISPKAQRIYPYGMVAAQTIGWVGPATQTEDIQLFAGDKFSSYLAGELCGREDGIEYVCEAVLRGKRGELFYDIDGLQAQHTEVQFGKDVTTTLDIQLQQRIEQYITDCTLNQNCKSPTSVAVVDIVAGDILAIVSLPAYDLNAIRNDYGHLAADPNKPLINRAINKQYPPGSVVKPLILIAGLETNKITAGEIISCPAKPAPRGWPNCWIYNRFKWKCHDDDWAGAGSNNARNAIKGSCNIYFSRLAQRIEPRFLQQWLFKFGYGQKPLPENNCCETDLQKRKFRQASGQISDIRSANQVTDFEQIPTLSAGESRWFGIGQGNLRASPLQVACSMAAIARSGLYRPARLFLNQTNNSVSLDISPQTLDIVRDGMYAVVNEPGGTAYSAFAYANFYQYGVKVYGKTGSTEAPENAWFAGFAEDSKAKGIAIAVVVEGGQHGSSDAAPVARDIIQFCIEAGYIGTAASYY